MNSSKGLHLKSYFASSVGAALELGQRELGEDALLVDTRLAPPAAMHLGRYEVVLAVAPDEQPAVDEKPSAPAVTDQPVPSAVEAAPPAPAAAAAAPAVETTAPSSPVAAAAAPAVETTAPSAPVAAAAAPAAHEKAQPETLSKVSAELSRIVRLLSDARIEAEFTSLPRELARFASELTSAGLETGIVDDFVQSVLVRLGSRPALASRNAIRKPVDADTIRAELTAELEWTLSTDAGLGLGDNGRRIVVLVGPPGAGKTTAIVKIAANYGLKSAGSVEILSTDMWRIGGAQQLSHTAEALGIGFRRVESTAALPRALAESKGLVLIDTPGFSPSEMRRAADLARCFAGCPDIDIHLVLPASMRPQDMASCARRFEVFRPGKLLFTKLDETDSYTGILCQALRAGKSMSFFSTGPAVPEDLEEATTARLIPSSGHPEEFENSTAA
jgi:flagellar biosynthesis protein FlhF